MSEINDPDPYTYVRLLHDWKTLKSELFEMREERDALQARVVNYSDRVDQALADWQAGLVREKELQALIAKLEAASTLRNTEESIQGGKE